MTSEFHADRERRRTAAAIKLRLRELSIQLALLNHQVSAQLALRDVDLACLDVLGREGPLSPSALARRAGLHPATMTGILDRLERGGWVRRERDPVDRRAVRVRAQGVRAGEVVRLYGGMNAALDDILASYDDTQLATLAEFLRRTAAAGRTATDHLAGSGPDDG